MAIIDTFLRVMVEKRAERLLLAADSVPVLLKGEETIDLSMPALRAETLRQIVREIGAGEAPDGPREGRCHAAGGAEFGYHVSGGPTALRLEFHAGRLPSPAGSADDSDPLAEAVAAFTGARQDEPEAAAPPGPAAAPDPAGIFGQAVFRGASDLFLSSGKPPGMRIQGVLRPLDGAPSADADILRLLPDDRAAEELARSGSVDFAMTRDLPDGRQRFRVNVFRHLGGVAAAIRPIRRQIPSLGELGLPGDLAELVSYSGGLVLVTGPSGAGKSTTLATLVDHLNRTRARHVITIEDPIEFEHREERCLIHQREVGTNVESFSSGLRAALRENPDVILLGEARELATISAALTAAETGHLVLATLHSGSASLAVNRIVDVFPGHQQAHVRLQLASSLRAVVSQRLVRSRKGRLVPAIERLMVTPPVAHGIREGQDHLLRDAMLTGGDEGMITLERSLASLVRKGLLPAEDALRHTGDPKALRRLLE